MRSYKPGWYARMEKGPAGRTVFDEKMISKVEEKVREIGKQPAKPRRRYLWATGMAAMIGLIVGAGVFYMMNIRPTGPSNSSPSVTAVPTEGPSTNLPSSTPAAETYISKEEAIELAKAVDPKGEGIWDADFVQESVVDPDKNIKRPIWAVVETFPLGNKTTVSIDAVDGRMWTTGDVEAPSAADRAASLKLWEGIHALDMTDSLNGWALTKTAVLKTTDGGQRWLDVTDAGMKANDGPAKAVGAYTDANIAVIAIPGSTGGVVNVFVTKNGGKTWEQSSIKSERFNDMLPYIQSIHFPDVNHGYILATFDAAMGSVTASVFRTADGGSTWTIASETDPTNAAKGGLPFSGHKSGIKFIDSQNGWLTGNWPGDNIYLFATHDGGMTWEPQTIAVPKGATAEGGAGFSFPPAFTDTLNGVMPVRLGPDRLIWFYRTKDGGKTWSAQESIDSDDLIWSFSRAGSGVALSGQQSWWSAEGGNFVKAGQLSSQSAPTVVTAADGRTAYAAGADFLAQTKDLGRTWSWSVPIVEQ